MITHENLHANFRQLMLDYFPTTGGVNPPDMAVVSLAALLSRHGPGARGRRSHPGRFPWGTHEPCRIPATPARWLRALAAGHPTWSASPNFAFELASAKVPR